MLGGVYVLTACPSGFLLVNSTLDTQACQECEGGKFSISSEHGCRVQSSGQDGWLGGCDNRACITCADGATCNKGSTASWKHFVPRPLQLGGQVLPWVSVIQGGKTVRLFCDQESMTCAPPSGAGSATTGPGPVSRDDHIWEFSEEISHFVLKRCPPGHRLVNSSSEGVFNPTRSCAVLADLARILFTSMRLHVNRVQKAQYVPMERSFCPPRWIVCGKQSLGLTGVFRTGSLNAPLAILWCAKRTFPMQMHVRLARSIRIVWKRRTVIPQVSIAERANPRPTAEEETLWRQWKDTGVFKACLGMKRLNIYRALIAS